MRQTGTGNGSDTRKNGPLMTAIVCVAMLEAAAAAGLAIRQIRVGPAVQEPVAQAEPPAQPAKAPDISPQPTPPAPVPQKVPMVVVQDAPPDVIPQPQQFQPQMGRRWGGGGPAGMEVFNNLTEEEQARLREGFMTMFQRFQNMTEEERQAEMARFQGMQQRFESMSDQEREQAMGRIQQRIEEWRQTGGSTEDLFDSITRDF